MRLGLRFFLSWILSSSLMFTLFYLWHGVFLNDFKRIQFPLTWFVTFAAFTYLVLGAGIYFLFESRLFKKFRNVFFRGIMAGVVAGISLIMIATIVHISITRHLSAEHLMIDGVWQVFEQVVGALIMVSLKLLIHEEEFEHV